MSMRRNYRCCPFRGEESSSRRFPTALKMENMDQLRGQLGRLVGSGKRNAEIILAVCRPASGADLYRNAALAISKMKLCIRIKSRFCAESIYSERRQNRSGNSAGLVAEAIWTRYMPSRNMIQEIIDSGIIGDISVLTANLSYPISHKERIMRPELAGGALLDIGVYGVNFAMMHFGTDIERIESSVRMTDTGVDAMESITIFFRGGRMAVLTHDIYSRSDRKGIFYEKGYIIVENINNPQSISVYDTEDRLVRRMDVPKQISGYEYEVLECIDAVRSGEKEDLHASF